MQLCSITASNLACQRGERILFRGLTLALSPGEACQILGTNGIGKSSLLRIIAGLLRPFAGNVLREGTIGLLDERPALDQHIPLDEALAFWARIDGGHDQAIERLGLAQLRNVPVRYLSTGQKKRAALARLIGQQAPIWLLDEPLNGLDHDAVALVETLVSEHCAAGGLCLVASHQKFTLNGMAKIELADYAPSSEGKI